MEMEALGFEMTEKSFYTSIIPTVSSTRHTHDHFPLFQKTLKLFLTCGRNHRGSAFAIAVNVALEAEVQALGGTTYRNMER